MTKNFCDKCSEEVLENTHVRISLFGNISAGRLVHKNLHLCEECYLEIDKKINNIFLIKTMTKA